MAFFHTLIAGSPTDRFAQFVYEFKQLAVAHGWVVVESGDGLSGYDSSDLITSSSVLAQSLAWFRIRQPSSFSAFPHSGTREFVFQNIDGSQADYFRVKYSLFSQFNLGSPSATEVPSATKEVVVAGSGTDASPVGDLFYFGGNPGGFVAVDTSTLSWYIIRHDTNPATICIIGFDYVIQCPYDSTDPDFSDLDPYVTLSSAGGNALPGALVSQRTARGYTFVDGVGYPAEYISDNWATYNGVVAPDSSTVKSIYDSSLILFPLYYKEPDSASAVPGGHVSGAGLKGYSEYVSTHNVSNAVIGNQDTVTVDSTKDHIIIGSCVWPWNGS